MSSDPWWDMNASATLIGIAIPTAIFGGTLDWVDLVVLAVIVPVVRLALQTLPRLMWRGKE